MPKRSGIPVQLPRCYLRVVRQVDEVRGTIGCRASSVPAGILGIQLVRFFEIKLHIAWHCGLPGAGLEVANSNVANSSKLHLIIDTGLMVIEYRFEQRLDAFDSCGISDRTLQNSNAML